MARGHGNLQFVMKNWYYWFDLRRKTNNNLNVAGILIKITGGFLTETLKDINNIENQLTNNFWYLPPFNELPTGLPTERSEKDQMG